MTSLSAVRTALVLVALAAAVAWIAWSQFGAERVSDLDDLQVGDCVEIPSGDFTDVIAVPTMRCSRSHNAELYLIGRLDRPRERAYPGAELVRREAIELCRGDAVDEYIGGTLESSGFEIVTMWPSEVDWRPTRGVVYCFVRLPGDASTSDRLGSAPPLR
jgi:hypothetical protein